MMIPKGHGTKLIKEHLTKSDAKGLGLIRGVIIDQHFIKRQRLKLFRKGLADTGRLGGHGSKRQNGHFALGDDWSQHRFGQRMRTRASANDEERTFLHRTLDACHLYGQPDGHIHPIYRNLYLPAPAVRTRCRSYSLVR